MYVVTYKYIPNSGQCHAETMLQINWIALKKMLLFTLMINAMDCAFMSLSKACCQHLILYKWSMPWIVLL